MQPLKNTCLFLLANSFLITGCADLSPGFRERDSFVVNTPEYADNRVFYMSKRKPEAKLDAPIPLLNSVELGQSASYLSRNSPLSVVLNTVSLPREEKSVLSRTKDIAVIIDLAAASDGSGKSLVAWYQRGVRPDQNLNFANLLLFYQEAWDDRAAPLVRIRVMDVTAERNLEMRTALAEVAKFQGVIGAAIPNPVINPIFEIGTKAASLVLASQQNKVLLEYTAQFYSKAQIEGAPSADLTPLQEGRFILLGKKDGDRSYWRQRFTYDPIQLDIIEGSTSRPVSAPFVVVTVASFEAVVPTSVAAKSAYLQKLLSDTQQSNIDQARIEVALLKGGVEAVFVSERLRRHPSVEALSAVVKVAGGPPSEIGEAERAMLIRAIARLSECPTIATPQQAKAWFDSIGSTATFKADGSFKIDQAKQGCP